MNLLPQNLSVAEGVFTNVRAFTLREYASKTRPGDTSPGMLRINPNNSQAGYVVGDIIAVPNFTKFDELEEFDSADKNNPKNKYIRDVFQRYGGAVVSTYFVNENRSPIERPYPNVSFEQERRAYEWVLSR